jgi:hypothetical protein
MPAFEKETLVPVVDKVFKVTWDKDGEKQVFL